ncbi:MAG TPA: hypothetical protein VKR06_20710 [Ktedonosporobacter sp.]|nr:hypothetical protein [Ktedonosporobacter sp.]
MQSIIETLDCGRYTFRVERGIDLAVGINQLIVWANERVDGTEEQDVGGQIALRHFYFEETNRQHIRNFCRKFALDSHYQREVLDRKTHWAKRNALFERNLPAALSEEKRFCKSGDKELIAHDFFHWLDKHVEQILALPEYQYLQAIDNAFEPAASNCDPHIHPAIVTLNGIVGVAARGSCQGVSGKVQYGERELLVVSPHEEFAYVSFIVLSQVAYESIITLLPEFPAISYTDHPSRFALRHVLCSTGDNLRFRKELAELAKFVQASLGSSID